MTPLSGHGSQPHDDQRRVVGGAAGRQQFQQDGVREALGVLLAMAGEESAGPPLGPPRARISSVTSSTRCTSRTTSPSGPNTGALTGLQ
ncbi:hypothetical protein [Streptomyces sp. NPDC007856]|uniref:hypothetical protein n=1 Tax=Streptomyces sp. NPDC007856 TaxID=3364781 RepID=UPI00368A4DF5